MYKLNTPYSGAKLAEEVFQTTKQSFYSHKQKYLDHLSDYFEWTMVGSKYVLTKELKPFETTTEKKSAEKKQEYYKERTDEIVSKEPYNSGANIARNIQQNNKYKVKQETVARYVRTVLKGFYISMDDRWSRPSEDKLHYIPLTEEELTYLHNLFKTHSNNELNFKYCAEFEAGNIDRQEFLELLGNNVLNDYQSIMSAFVEKYGYRPIKTKKFEPKTKAMEESFSWE